MSQFDPASSPPPVPIPVQPLAYSTPWQQNRPGLITTIGVMCIVVACLGILGNLWSGLQGFGLLMMSALSARTTSSVSMSTSSSSAGTTNEKLTVGEAGVADNTLRAMLSLDSKRQRELDKLLRTHGRVILGGEDDQPLTAAGIRQAVTQYKSAALPTDPALFTTELGTVNVYPDRAEFTRNDGTQTVRTSSAGNSESITSSSNFNASQSVGANGSTTLTSAQLQQVLNAVKTHSPPTLNSQQLSALRAQLSAPNQQLVTPGSGSPVMNVMPQGNNVVVQFDAGMVTLGPQGQIVQVFSYSSSAITGPVGMPNFSAARTPAVLMLLESLASLALAIYLLIVGILVFRASFKSPRLLRIYAWLKVPLAIVGGIAQAWLWSTFFLGVSTAGGASSTGPTSVFVIGWAAGMILVGIAFPIGLLIALRTKTARDYYSAAGAG